MDHLRQSDHDAILPVAIGTALWLVILVVLVAMRASLEENGTLWWMGAAAVGFVSGAVGLVFLRWRAGRMRRSGQE